MWGNIVKIMGKTEALFNKFDLISVLERNRQKLREVASTVSQESLLDESLEKLAEIGTAKLRVEPIVLLEDEIAVEQREAQVDVSQDTRRAISNRNRPFYISGILVSYFVPFTGEQNLFYCKPNTFTLLLPRARIEASELIFEFSVTDGEISRTKDRFEEELARVKQWLSWQYEQIGTFNLSLEREILPLLKSRKEAVEKSNSQFSDLGYKIRQKASTDARPERNPIVRKAKADPKRKSEKPEVSYDVALSFAGEDREYVEKVANVLKENEILVFYDKFETVTLWGKNLVDHLEDVYKKRSEFIVMFISKHYPMKSWTIHERKSAQTRAVMEQKDCILPARFDDTEIPGLHSTVGYVDLKTLTPEKFAQLIIEKIRNGK